MGVISLGLSEDAAHAVLAAVLRECMQTSRFSKLPSDALIEGREALERALKPNRV